MRTKTRNKIFSIIMASLMLFFTLAIPVSADEPNSYTFDINQDSVWISAGTATGTIKVSSAGTTIDDIPSTTEFIITGNNNGKNHNISVAGGVNANLTFDNLTINNANTTYAYGLIIGGNSQANVTLLGTNSLVAGWGAVSITVAAGNSVVFTEKSTGSLSVRNSNTFYPDIGGPYNGGDITINGGTIDTGKLGNSQSIITVNGGTMNADRVNSNEVILNGGKINTSNFNASSITTDIALDSIWIYAGTNAGTTKLKTKGSTIDNIPSTTEYIFVGNNNGANHNAQVTDGVTANITFDNLTINNTNTGYAYGLRIGEGSTANVTLVGNNTLMAGSGTSAVSISAGNTIVFTEESTGSLNAQ
ncbi:MAG: hypothetical protein ACK5LC_08910, partial [Coprobacillaceae bacterium]